MKKYVITKEQVKPLVNDNRGALTTLAITVDGEPIGIMWKQKTHLPYDSGWRFCAGSESEDFTEKLVNNSEVYCLNVIANIDPAIIPYLNAPDGTYLVRIVGTNQFIAVEKGTPIEC